MWFGGINAGTSKENPLSEMVDIYHPDLKVTSSVPASAAPHFCADPPAGGGWKLATKKQSEELAAEKEAVDAES